VTITKKHALVWGCFFLAVVAFVLHIEQMYFMAAALALLAPVSYLLARRKTSGLQAQRRCPDRMYAGDTAGVKVEVTNRAATRRSLFQVADTLPEGTIADPASAHLIADLGPGETTSVEYDLTPLRRGVYRLGPVRFTSSDSLGIYDFSGTDDCFSEILVYPTPLSLPDLWPRGSTAEFQRRRRGTIGQGDDFYSIREYVPGDDLRRVSWANTARRGKLMVVETERRETFAATIVLDLTANVHAGRGENSSLEYGVVLAASLAHQALQHGAVVGLLAMGTEDYSVPVSDQLGQELAILEALARCQDDCPARLDAVVTRREVALGKAGCVAIISPQTGAEMIALAARLVAQGNAVSWYCLQTLSFEPHTRADSEQREARSARFAVALRQAGAQCHLISGTRPLELSFRRWSRAAS